MTCLANHRFSLFYSFLIFLAIITVSCDALTGEEIARISDNQISTEESLDWKTAELDLKAGDEIGFWAEMDMEYEGNLGLRFQVQVIYEKDTLGIMEIDPMDKNITLGEVKTEIMDKTSWSYTGKVGSYTVENDGHYAFRTILISSPNETLKLEQADLVFKK